MVSHTSCSSTDLWKTPPPALIFSTLFLSLRRLPGLHHTTNSSNNWQDTTITGIFTFLDFQDSAMPFTLLICHFLLVPFHVNWNFSSGLPFLIILILICHAHIISSADVVNLLLNLLTYNFQYQHLNIFKPSTDLVLSVHYMSRLICIVHTAKLWNMK